MNDDDLNRAIKIGGSIGFENRGLGITVVIPTPTQERAQVSYESIISKHKRVRQMRV